MNRSAGMALLGLSVAALVAGGCATAPVPIVAVPLPAKSQPGVTASNAKFAKHEAYLKRLVEAVQLEWDKLLDGSSKFPPSGSYVVVHFFINSDGSIVKFGDVENHSSDWGARACVAAIANRAPYGEWTDDMKATLNPDGEELIFTFYYQ